MVATWLRVEEEEEGGGGGTSSACNTGCAVLMQTGAGPSSGITRCQLCHLLRHLLSTRFAPRLGYASTCFVFRRDIASSYSSADIPDFERIIRSQSTHPFLAF